MSLFNVCQTCYDSLVLGKGIKTSLGSGGRTTFQGAFDSGHGSVFEHAYVNFIVTDCSRVFTHELVRHRVGTAFSQTSGHYVRGEGSQCHFDPILEPVKQEGEMLVFVIEKSYGRMVDALGLNGKEGIEEHPNKEGSRWSWDLEEKKYQLSSKLITTSK